MKLNYKRTVLIGLAFLSICAFWQMYDSIIPLILQNTFGIGETLTGAIMAADNVLAIFLLPLFGALSDKTDTRFGRRMPFIVTGTVLAVIFLMLLPIADRQVNVVLFIVSLFALLVSMGLYRSPAVALMPDLTPNKLRSKGNAIINLMGAVGGVYTLIMIKLLVGKGDRPDYMLLFVSVAALMVISVGILVITISEKKIEAKVAAEIKAYEDSTGLKVETEDTIEEEQLLEAEKNSSDENKGKTVKMQMSPEVKRSMAFLLTSIFLWFTAYNAVTTAFSRYTKVVWHLEGGGFADCLMVATVAAILSYVPIGNLAGRIGRKKTILVGIVLMSICYFAAIFVGQYHGLVNVAFAVIGIGWAAINVNSYPMIVEMSKGSDIGKFTGTYYTFSMAAQILTPILSGFLLENVSYRTLFPYAFVFSVLAFITMAQVRHGDARPDKKKSLLENFDVDD
ncbi:MFS transporter [Suilimivivens aceti]|uniref:MFS transporter n=1 Tax=Suilimivivens aceti TaxID=2981774 RepID=A0ABT2T023_9FIRM|nr:MFS transporter [Suilimivivens aceti]MCU6743596.1 MFS transporter [Suilimivivens aceti]SCH30274.1 multidrug efflux system translocase MdfA [uncultured Clostridium sp.]